MKFILVRCQWNMNKILWVIQFPDPRLAKCHGQMKWPPELAHYNLLYNENLFLLFFCSHQDQSFSSYLNMCSTVNRTVSRIMTVCTTFVGEFCVINHDEFLRKLSCFLLRWIDISFQGWYLGPHKPHSEYFSVQIFWAWWLLPVLCWSVTYSSEHLD